MIDRHVVLTVVCLIGFALLLLIAGIIYSGIRDAPLDAGVTALAGSALGYLGGLLTNVSRRPEKAGDSAPVIGIPVQPESDGGR